MSVLLCICKVYLGSRSDQKFALVTYVTVVRKWTPLRTSSLYALLGHQNEQAEINQATGTQLDEMKIIEMALNSKEKCYDIPGVH